ncbi:MAG: hypothetical protein RBR74_06725 [Ignavibacteriaceae bacterium]|jgi:hypothetical protein|nr:hypothetical protein [Ignavibacteriaceae bacterium]
MKKILSLMVLFVLLVACNGNGQPKNDYEIGTTAVTGITKYHFFLEKKGASPYQLTQGMDYLSPSVITLKVGESITISDTSLVALVTNRLPYRKNFEISVANVKDKAGNLIDPNHKSVWYFYNGYAPNKFPNTNVEIERK